MPDHDIPAEAPPSYQDATGNASSSASRPAASSSTNPASATLEVPGEKNGIPASYRRSMEDEQRPLPQGWVRTYDPQHEHQYFVDTTKDPPRSVWVHPYDDEEYLSSLPSEERERIEEEDIRHQREPTKADIIAGYSDIDDHDEPSSSTSAPGELPPRPDGKGKGKGNDDRSFGRKFKDKVTGTTHAQREEIRKQRAEQEREMYSRHLAVRRAMGEAARTGQPQHIGKDGDGKDIYVEPPAAPQGPYSYGNGYGYNAYRGGVYTTPNARYIRPPNPYARPAGYGYGGGYGMPLALGGGLLGGGLLGGMMLGDAMGGGFGGGGM